MQHLIRKIGAFKTGLGLNVYSDFLCSLVLKILLKKTWLHNKPYPFLNKRATKQEGKKSQLQNEPGKLENFKGQKLIKILQTYNCFKNQEIVKNRV